jgi:sec-independent protein translocase protein TatA
MFGLRPLEIIIIVLAVVLLFGASRLPQLARSIGQTRKAFKEGLREADEDDEPVADRKQIDPQPAASDLTDEEILAEMQRRSETHSKV